MVNGRKFGDYKLMQGSWTRCIKNVTFFQLFAFIGVTDGL